MTLDRLDQMGTWTCGYCDPYSLDALTWICKSSIGPVPEQSDSVHLEIIDFMQRGLLTGRESKNGSGRMIEWLTLKKIAWYLVSI